MTRANKKRMAPQEEDRVDIYPPESSEPSVRAPDPAPNPAPLPVPPVSPARNARTAAASKVKRAKRGVLTLSRVFARASAH